MADERMLAFLRELERADEAAAATLAELDELAAGVEEVRLAAQALEAARLRLPAEREAAALARETAEREVDERRAAHAAAAGELEEARATQDRARITAAERAELRARDLARMADRRLEAARAEGARLAESTLATEREAVELGTRAADLAAALAERRGLGHGAGRTPAGGLDGLARWATDARAALFVARGSLASERDGLIRQANELGSAVLGEPLSASSAAGVARRVEEAAP